MSAQSTGGCGHAGRRTNLVGQVCEARKQSLSPRRKSAGIFRAGMRARAALRLQALDVTADEGQD